MLIGIIGAPNKGKSTLFSALTMHDVAIADYPFTTIDPNKGIAYATDKCPHVELGVGCKARNSLCVNGIRQIPVNVMDVAGLVEGAHLGKGMGNKFLNDLASADALVIVADASGKTDAAGNPTSSHDPVEDVEMVRDELAEWLSDIIRRHMKAISKQSDGISALAEVLTGLKIGKDTIAAAVAKNELSSSRVEWDDEGVAKFSATILEYAKPWIVVANKMDSPGSESGASSLERKYGKERVFRMSSAVELALEKAERSGMIKWAGERDFSIVGNASAEQKRALDYMRSYLAGHGMASRALINRVVFELLGNIVVYPVEDEHKYSDSMGNVLPDAILLHKGATAQDLAAVIHTEIADKMLYAIDARKKMRMAKDHRLQDGDIVKIVSAAR
ncbi:MAG: YchF-related putative GTPase [Candidatus Micrarchaeota archaeon]|nr:YchF-related putative GTPase [Candidatus Micrarchaeota archaeon]